MEPGRSTMYQGVEKASAAFRLMQQMGWAEGDGLGRERQGIREHIRIRKKDDNAGIGLSQKALAQANWMLNTKTYENILSNLKVVAVDGPEVQEDKIEPKEIEEQKTSSTALSHGRVNKKRQKKAVGTYSNVEVDEVLGVSKGNTNVASLQVNSNSQSDGVILGEFPNSTKQSYTDQVCEKISTYNGSSKLWWCLFGFVRAGTLGSSSALTTHPTKSAGFQERDQENLYKLVFDTATKSRRGLGVDGKKSKKGTFPTGQNTIFKFSDTECVPITGEPLTVKADLVDKDAETVKKEKKAKKEKRKAQEEIDRTEEEKEKIEVKKEKKQEIKGEKEAEEQKSEMDERDRMERKEERRKRKQEKRARKEEEQIANAGEKERTAEMKNEATSGTISDFAETTKPKKRKKDAKGTT